MSICIATYTNPQIYRYGTDSFRLIHDGIYCDSANYLTISQCRIMGRITSDCVDGDDDLSVICCKFEGI